jgi:hypothetical protein
MDSEFRQLDEREKGLLEKLFEAEFPGRDELRTQLNSLTGKQIEEDGTLSLQCGSGLPSPSKYGLAVEGWCKDADGMTIAVMVHIGKGGFMHMLEIVKHDGSPIINLPSADNLIVLLPESGGRKPGEEVAQAG